MRPLVVGANILFAAFIREGPTREIILDGGLDLRSPPWLWEEVAARYSWLEEKSRLDRRALDELLRQLRARIADIPASAIEQHRTTALATAGRAGRKDAPYIAAVLAVDGVLWTHDGELAKTSKVAVVTTAELVRKRQEGTDPGP